MKRRDPEALLISISRIRIWQGVEVSCLRLRGTVRGTTEGNFRGRLFEAGQRSPYLTLNLSELEYISSEGLGTLLEQAEIQSGRGGWLRVIAPSPTVAMIFRLSGVSEALPTHVAEEDALSDLPTRAA